MAIPEVAAAPLQAKPHLVDRFAFEIDSDFTDLNVPISIVAGGAAGISTHNVVGGQYPQANEYHHITNQAHALQAKASELQAAANVAASNNDATSAQSLSARATGYQVATAAKLQTRAHSFHPNLEAAASYSSGFLAFALAGVGLFNTIRWRANTVRRYLRENK